MQLSAFRAARRGIVEKDFQTCFSDTNTRVPLRHVETHVSHACNLTCGNCSHYCDIGYPEKIDHDAALASIVAWSKRIRIKQFALLGGEPLIEKRLADYVLTVADVFSYAERRVVTNGVMLYKYDDSFAKRIKDTETRLIVSLHVVPESRKEALAKSLAMLKGWIQKYSLDVTIKPIDSRWFRLYRGRGVNILPFTDGDQDRSREHCVTPCVNLHQGALWKCPPLAYLPMIAKKLKYKEAWEPYLQYRPLQLSASDEELHLLSSDSSCCGMCPVAPKLDVQQRAM